ncbi:hypothetical protein D3C79_871110 [compost metagenome]
MPVVTGKHQQGVAIAIAQVHRQAVFQQAPEHYRVALARPVEHLFGERRSLVVVHGRGATLVRHGEPPGYRKGPSLCQGARGVNWG